MGIELDLVWEVPFRAGGSVVGATAQDDGARVLVADLVRVLPYVAHQVAHAERRVALRRVRGDGLRPTAGGTRAHGWVVGRHLGSG